MLLYRENPNIDAFNVSPYLLQMFCSAPKNFIVELFSLLDEMMVKHNIVHLSVLKKVFTKIYTPHSFLSCSLCSLWPSLVPHDFNEPRFFKYPWGHWYLGGSEVFQKQLWIKRIIGIFPVHKYLQPSWRGSKVSTYKQYNLFIQWICIEYQMPGTGV